MKRRKTKLVWIQTMCLLLVFVGVILLGQALLEINYSKAAGYSLEDLDKRFTIDKIQDEDELYENLKMPLTQIFVGKAQELYPGVSADVALERALGRTSGGINDLYISPDLQKLTNQLGNDRQSILTAEDSAQKMLVDQLTMKIQDEVATNKVQKQQSINQLKKEIMSQGTDVSNLLDEISSFLPALIPAGA